MKRKISQVLALSGISAVLATSLAGCAPSPLTEEQHAEASDASIAAVMDATEGTYCWDAVAFDMTVDEFLSNIYQLNGITIVRSYESEDEFSYNGVVTIYAGKHELKYVTTKNDDGEYKVSVENPETIALLEQYQCPPME